MFANVYAQSMPEYILNEVVVTGVRTPTLFKNINRDITVITADDIQSMQGASLQEVLNHTVGIEVRPRGPNDIQADLSIRGGSFEQNIILIDGIRLTDPQTGHHLMNLPVQITDIERIEILHGHGSRLYGANAVGGVINIITRKPEDSSVKFRGEGGQYGYWEGSTSLAFPLLSSSTFLSLSRGESDGYIDASEFKNTVVRGGLRIPLSEGELGFLYGYTDKIFGANTFYSDQFPNEWEHTTTTLTAIRGKMGYNSVQLSTNLSLRRNEDDFVLDNDDPNWYRNKHTTEVYSLEIIASIPLNSGMFSLGSELTTETIESSNLGNHDRDRIGVSFEHQFDLSRRFDLVWGSSIYNHSESGITISPGIDIGMQVRPEWKLYSSIGSSYREPTFTELYYDSPANKGNPDLAPEKNLSTELGSIFFGTGYKIKTAVFHRVGADQIDWVRRLNTDPWQVQNIKELITDGFEIGLDFFALEQISHSVIPRFNIGYQWLNISRDFGNYESKYSLSNSRHLFTVNIYNRLPFGLRQNWNLRYKDRMDFENYTVIDTGIQRDLGFLNLYLRVTNLFDRTYSEIASVQMPGRWIKGGFNYKLK